MNAARPYFKTGVKEFNIPPFDPFYAQEVVQVRGSHGLYYKLTIRNVYERGWTNSHVYKFQSDLNNQLIRYHQFFPAKYLDGSWEIETNIFKPYKNSGTFNLGLCKFYRIYLSLLLLSIYILKGTYLRHLYILIYYLLSPWHNIHFFFCT